MRHANDQRGCAVEHHGVLQPGEHGSYSENDCTVTLSTQVSPSIAAGRIWGTLSCPAEKSAGSGVACYATATFIFQNCQQ